jgi:hypothetical protein
MMSFWSGICKDENKEEWFHGLYYYLTNPLGLWSHFEVAFCKNVDKEEWSHGLCYITCPTF